MGDKHYLVPVQFQGVVNDIEHSVTFQIVEDAEDMFVDSKNRMLDVNNWQKNSKQLGVAFYLTDHHGKAITRKAHKGDYIHIEMETGKGVARLMIDAIEYDDYPDEDFETFAMHMRPSNGPQEKRDNDIARLYSGDLTATLVIERRANKLAALYHGRGDAANVGTDMPDAMQSVWAGLSDVQWSALIAGLIET